MLCSSVYLRYRSCYLELMGIQIKSSKPYDASYKMISGCLTRRHSVEYWAKTVSVLLKGVFPLDYKNIP